MTGREVAPALLPGMCRRQFPHFAHLATANPSHAAAPSEGAGRAGIATHCSHCRPGSGRQLIYGWRTRLREAFTEPISPRLPAPLRGVLPRGPCPWTSSRLASVPTLHGTVESPIVFPVTGSRQTSVRRPQNRVFHSLPLPRRDPPTRLRRTARADAVKFARDFGLDFFADLLAESPKDHEE